MNENSEVTSKAAPPIITRLIDGRWDRHLRNAIYETVRKEHKIAKGLAARNVDIAAGVGIRESHFCEAAKTILAVRRVWRTRVSALNAVPDPDDLYSLHDLPDSVISNMLNCQPVGVFYDRRVLERSCKKHMVCPLCRYRYGMMILDKLGPHLRNADIIASVSIAYGEAGGLFDWDPSILKKLITALCKRNRTWICDAAVTLPVRDKIGREWMLSTTIIALAKKGTMFMPPECLVDPRQPYPRFLLGKTWRCKPANKANLARAVCRAIRYPAPLLFAGGISNAEFAELVNLSKRMRVAFHGVPRRRRSVR